MCVFIDFWKLETENSLLHVFSFLHKLSFENSFCFLPILSCQTSFFVLKIENCFWKQKTRGKNSYQTYPKFFSPSLCHNIYNTSSLKIHPLASCKFYGYQKEIDIMDGLNSYRCSNVNGMSKVFFFFFFFF